VEACNSRGTALRALAQKQGRPTNAAGDVLLLLASPRTLELTPLAETGSFADSA
jgi:hypothetical protein